MGHIVIEYNETIYIDLYIYIYEDGPVWLKHVVD
jgi:hypothetical protein